MRFTSKTLPLAAIALAAVGLGCSSIAGDAVDTGPETRVSAKQSGPIACALEITPGLFGLTFAGTAEASQDVAGTYDLKIQKNGRSGSATISQGGEFRLRAGETETLGEATLSGDPSEFDAELVVTVEGQRVTCRDSGAIDL